MRKFQPRLEEKKKIAIVEPNKPLKIPYQHPIKKLKFLVISNVFNNIAAELFSNLIQKHFFSKNFCNQITKRN
jgi:hypothetical protein